MLNVYLDTNIYYISHTVPKSNSRLIIKSAMTEDFFLIQSDYLYAEIKDLFKREFGKDISSYQQMLMRSLPLKDIITENSWLPLVKDYDDLITDKDDLPHVCCYFAGTCDYFVTTNRRLTRQKIGEKVNFINPKKFVVVLGLKPVDTVNEI